MGRRRVTDIADVDISEAHRRVEQCCASISPEVQFNTQKLVEFLRDNELHVDIQTVYGWKASRIITPAGGDAERRRPDEYDAKQIRRATMAAYLATNSVPPTQILAAVTFWSSAFQQSRSVTIDIEQVERAQLLLVGRILGIATGLAIGSEGPPTDCVLICRRIEPNALRKPAVRLDMKRLPALPELTPGPQFVGYTVKQREAEVLARISNYADALSRARDDRLIFSIQVHDPNGVELAEPVEFLLGLRKEPEDGRARDIIQREVRGNPFEEVTEDGQALLYRLLRFAFPTLVDFPRLYHQSARREYARLPGSDLLDALATSVVMANPSWRSAAFWAREEGDVLRIRGTSPAYTGDPHAVLKIGQQESLESWVFRTGQSLVMEDIAASDPRIPASQRERLGAPFAMVPAMSVNGPSGILFVTRNNDLGSGTPPFRDEIPLLQVLGGVLAEAHERLHIADVTHLVRDSRHPSPDPSSEADLQNALASTLSERIPPYNHEKEPPYYVVLFGVRIDSEDGQDIKEWYDKVVGQQILAVFDANGNDRSGAVRMPARLYRLGRGELVVLAEQVEDLERIDMLRARLSELMSGFSKEFQAASIHQWASYFSYSYLARTLRARQGTDPRDAHDQAKFMIAQARNDIANAHLYSAANRHIREGNHADAVPPLKRAIRDQPTGYSFRHLSEAFAGMGEWSDAEDWARKAISLDEGLEQPYAGSHVSLARALIGKGAIGEGLEELGRAARMSPDLEYQLGFAEALIIHGASHEQYAHAVDILDELLLRPGLPGGNKARICYLCSKAQIRLGDVPAAKRCLKKALSDFSPGNAYIRWELDSIESGNAILST